jgi:IS5 family transposase
MNVDKEHRLILHDAVTDASVHDSRVFDDILVEVNADRSVWADAAYRSEAREEKRRAQGCKSRIHQKGTSRCRLIKREQAANRRCSN